ncbi:uncharacterized protein RCC_00574 [Ramularia collo-cygni]|uniref:BTB domain-containing protein n=1 Tax=Ramularia collo-cygni TaxID=112498 RepID=A0A2D3UZG3_9PEZI|nr:uncharacterized protein RCC_00574 [Ramularia collo-cygni]CZT14599.1 uncharacterized protein RCC_00574 [Ramularia collo-cygni]
MATNSSTKDGTLRRMYETEEWADLTIKTATKDFKVHKSIVCPACPFFHAACTNEFKESHTGIIHLEDSASVVDAILRHLYELPIEWLSYRQWDLEHAVTPGGSAAVMPTRRVGRAVSKMPKSKDVPTHERMKRILRKILDLELAVNKYDIKGINTTICASFLFHFEYILDIKCVVETGAEVFDEERPPNKTLRAVVAMETSWRLDEIIASPCAWEIFHSNEDYMKETVSPRVPRTIGEIFRGNPGTD